MELISETLPASEIERIQERYGRYIKITADIARGLCVVGCELHADGEEILLRRGSRQDDIWGGGLDFYTKEIDTSAVLNLRPRLGNNSMEILDNKRREAFLGCVRRIFSNIWAS